MKNGHFHRIQRGKGSSKKDSGEGESKPSGRKQSDKARTVKKGGAGSNDDDSVDSRGNIRGLIVYSDEESISDDSTYSENESDDTRLTPEQKQTIRRSARKAALKARERIQRRLKKEEEEEKRSKKLRAAPSSTQKKKKQVIEESEEEEEEDDFDDEELTEDSEEYSVEEDEEEEDEEEDEEEEEEGQGGFSISFGGFVNPMKPKRHNMKKEPEHVKKFVKLITAPMEDNTIDDQIDQFKALATDKQNQMLAALERKASPDASQNLMFRILTMNLPPETQSMVLAKYNSLQSLDSSSGEYFKLRAWLEKLTSLPLGIYKEMPLTIVLPL